MGNKTFFRTYLLSRFKLNYRLSGDNTELIVPSIFAENDFKRHMSINLTTGLWRCFKTGKRGNFVKLYSLLENIPYRVAYEKFLFENFLNEDKEVEEVKKINNLDDTSKFEVCKDNLFIKERLLDSFTFYIAKEGFYKDRLIIPFFNSSGKLFYFQARALGNANPKYLNCKNYKSSEIIYPYEYDAYTPLFITEGVFDTLSLIACGINSTSTLSCNTSDAQMEQLKQYRGPLVCAFDNDEAGKKGARQFLRVAYKHKRNDLFYCSPPNPIKDWNELLVKKGPDAVINHLNTCKPLNTLIDAIEL